jgi:hypothetical protein
VASHGLTSMTLSCDPSDPQSGQEVQPAIPVVSSAPSDSSPAPGTSVGNIS